MLGQCSISETILRCWGIWTTWTLLNWWRPSLCLILAIVVYKMLGQWCIDVSWSLSSGYVGGEHPGHVKLARLKCLGISAFGKLKPVKDILTTVVVHYMNGQSVQLYKWYAGAILVPLNQNAKVFRFIWTRWSLMWTWKNEQYEWALSKLPCWLSALKQKVIKPTCYQL